MILSRQSEHLADDLVPLGSTGALEPLWGDGSDHVLDLDQLLDLQDLSCCAGLMGLEYWAADLLSKTERFEDCSVVIALLSISYWCRCDCPLSVVVVVVPVLVGS